MENSGIYGVILGLALIFWGRKFFWLFVGVVGFITGMEFVPQLVSSPILSLALSVFFGIVSAILAIVFYKLAILSVGFFAAGYLALNLFVPSELKWILFIVAGLLGAVAMAIIFDWTLIVLSALVGADLVLQGLGVNVSANALIYILIAAAGVVIQGFGIGKIGGKK